MTAICSDVLCQDRVGDGGPGVCEMVCRIVHVEPSGTDQESVSLSDLEKLRYGGGALPVSSHEVARECMTTGNGSPTSDCFAVTAVCSNCEDGGRDTPPICSGLLEGPRWMLQTSEEETICSQFLQRKRPNFWATSVRYHVDRSIYPRTGIDDRTGPENLEVYPRFGG